MSQTRGQEDRRKLSVCCNCFKQACLGTSARCVDNKQLAILRVPPTQLTTKFKLLHTLLLDLSFAPGLSEALPHRHQSAKTLYGLSKGHYWLVKSTWTSRGYVGKSCTSHCKESKASHPTPIVVQGNATQDPELFWTDSAKSAHTFLSFSLWSQSGWKQCLTETLELNFQLEMVKSGGAPLVTWARWVLGLVGAWTL